MHSKRNKDNQKSFSREDLSSLVYKGKFQYDFSKSNILGDFDCSYLGLKTLEGSPRTVIGTFNCSNNQLTNLRGAPKQVNTYFDCSGNPILKLEGLHQQTIEHFKCTNTRIKNLKGLENVEIRKLYINDNKFLESIEGIPNSVINNGIIGSWYDFNSNIYAQISWYKENGHGYTDFWNDMLMYYIKNDPKFIELNVKWPEGLINEELKKSAKGLSKYNL